jgi:hypothetical protein
MTSVFLPVSAITAPIFALMNDFPSPLEDDVHQNYLLSCFWQKIFQVSANYPELFRNKSAAGTAYYQWIEFILNDHFTNDRRLAWPSDIIPAL